MGFSKPMLFFSQHLCWTLTQYFMIVLCVNMMQNQVLFHPRCARWSKTQKDSKTYPKPLNACNVTANLKFRFAWLLKDGQVSGSVTRLCLGGSYKMIGLFSDKSETGIMVSMSACLFRFNWSKNTYIPYSCRSIQVVHEL